MRIGYLRLDFGEWNNNNRYNSQEVGVAKAFEQLGHEVIIFYWVDKKSNLASREVALTNKIRKVYIVGHNAGHHSVGNLNQIRKYQLDLLHIQGDNLLLVPNTVRFCEKNHIPHYCYVGTIDSSNSKMYMRKIMDIIVMRNIRAYKKCATFVKTPFVKEQLEARGVKNVIVAPVGLDLSIIPEVTLSKEELRTELKLPRDKKVIVSVSRLVADKRPHDIFELARYLNDNYYYVFIGSWKKEDNNRFKEMITENNLTDRFRYIERLPNNEIHKYYKTADYFVNFNDREIFGMSILEAMYQNCIVVARSAPGPEFTIERGITGQLADTVQEMAEYIEGNRIDSPSDNGKRRIINSFTWDSTAIRILQSYQESITDCI